MTRNQRPVSHRLNLVPLRRAVILLSFAAMAEAAVNPLDRQFDETVKPFVAKYCAGCHSGQTPAAQLDLKAYSNKDAVIQDYARWA